MAKKAHSKSTDQDRKVPLLVEDDSWGMPRQGNDPFYTPEGSPAPSVAKRLYDRVRSPKG